MSPKGLKSGSQESYWRLMKITMHDENITSIAQLKSFLKEIVPISFSITSNGNKNKQELYDWVDTVITRFRYFSLKKRKEKRIVLDYIAKITKRSRPQIKRLIWKKKKFKKIKLSTVKKNVFPVLYGTSDISRLIETDNAHGRLSAPATKRILEREYLVYDKIAYEQIRHISVPHIYNLRKKRQYISNILFIAKTPTVDRNIGERRKPQPLGKPGYVRVDSVHQGDLDKEKGVYHINMVDETTQWEVIGCVEGISEQFLLPLLEELLELFPFIILEFHSDNGSEYINHTVAKLLTKMMIDQTKSRSRRTNDNALVEGKNGAVIRKHMGRSYIQKSFAKNINVFYRDYMNEYLNFHRPCGFSTDMVDDRGKLKKIYDRYMTPYENLISIPNFELYLKPGITSASLSVISNKQSDNESAQKMQKAKTLLFKSFVR